MLLHSRQKKLNKPSFLNSSGHLIINDTTSHNKSHVHCLRFNPPSKTDWNYFSHQTAARTQGDRWPAAPQGPSALLVQNQACPKGKASRARLYVTVMSNLVTMATVEIRSMMREGLPDRSVICIIHVNEPGGEGVRRTPSSKNKSWTRTGTTFGRTRNRNDLTLKPFDNLPRSESSSRKYLQT